MLWLPHWIDEMNPSHDLCNMCNRPMRKRDSLELVPARRRVLTCVRPLLRPFTCRGPVWWSRVGSRSRPRARWHSVAPWVSRSCLTTVAPNLSLPSSAPTTSRPMDGLCRRGRRLVDATFGHQGPDDPRHPVRKRHPHQHWRLTRQHPAKPRSRPCRNMDVPLDDDAVGPDDQQPSQGALAHLRCGPEALLAPGGMLSWRQARPRRKVPRLPERVRRRREDRDCASSQTHLGTLMPTGGGHIIRAPGRRALLDSCAQ